MNLQKTCNVKKYPRYIINGYLWNVNYISTTLCNVATAWGCEHEQGACEYDEISVKIDPTTKMYNFFFFPFYGHPNV
jgi:hypothetical protein